MVVICCSATEVSTHDERTRRAPFGSNLSGNFQKGATAIDCLRMMSYFWGS
jgi:hypothetical protein